MAKKPITSSPDVDDFPTGPPEAPSSLPSYTVSGAELGRSLGISWTLRMQGHDPIQFRRADHPGGVSIEHVIPLTPDQAAELRSRGYVVTLSSEG